jgi:hypothetical protein
MMEIQQRPPNQMCADLARKFNDDINTLLARSTSIMIDSIGPQETVSIMMTILAFQGLELERHGIVAKGSFLEIVKYSESQK